MLAWRLHQRHLFFSICNYNRKVVPPVVIPLVCKNIAGKKKKVKINVCKASSVGIK